MERVLDVLHSADLACPAAAGQLPGRMLRHARKSEESDLHSNQGSRRARRRSHRLILTKRGRGEFQKFTLSYLGWVLAKQDHWPEVLAILEDISENDVLARYPEFYKLLGDVYRIAGRRANACEAWRKALMLFPKTTVLMDWRKSEIEKKLKSSERSTRENFGTGLRKRRLVMNCGIRWSEA
jgi:hypothetical protein